MQFLHKPDMFDHFWSSIKTNIVTNCFPIQEGSTEKARGYIQSETAFAILSHRWSEELTFLDMANIAKSLSKSQHILSNSTQDPIFFVTLERECRNLVKGRMLPGLTKLFRFCHVAWLNGYSYAWIDTCCIDKSSSAELEETIRSMFHWYRQSTICIVHLSESEYIDQLRSDTWFKRGWTLQELLAPRAIRFYDKHWKSLTDGIMDKKASGHQNHKERHLWSIISEITDISTHDLLDFKPGLEDIWKRLHWASHRQTTRIEDMAYCLVGIFDISLPISYGEGRAAFYRLQVEIMQRSNDKGLFMWDGEASPFNSMLAAGPECFSENLMADGFNSPNLLHSTFKLTNNGLRIPLALSTVEYKDFKSKYVMEVEGQSIEVEDQMVKKSPQHPVKCFQLAIIGHSFSFSSLRHTITTTPLAILLCGHKYDTNTLYKRVPRTNIFSLKSLSKVEKTNHPLDSSDKEAGSIHKILIQ